MSKVTELFIPPHSTQAEQAVLGSVLIDSTAWKIARQLQAEDFFRPDHALIFRAIRDLADAGQPIDILTVDEQIKRRAEGDAEEAGGLAYLSTLSRDTPTSANIKAYAQLVLERAVQRAMLSVSRELAAQGGDIEEVASAAQSRLRALQDRLREILHPDDTLRQRHIDWTSLEGRTPPAREWDINHWLPRGKDTLIAGRGGIGKTLLIQMMATALATGRDFIDFTAQRTVLVWAGEDDQDELWRRQININQHFDLRLNELSRLHLASYHQDDITLAALAFGVLTPTPLLNRLREQVADLKAEVVILDNVARIFGGNENDRHQVTQFMAWLRAAVAPASLVLLSHPSRAAGSEFSGSSAWEGSVRTRLWLSDHHPDQKDGGDDAEENIDERVRYLSRRKANYAQNDLRKLILEDGILVPEQLQRQQSFARVSGDFAKDIVRRAVRALAAREIHGQIGTRGGAYLPRLAEQYGLLENITVGQFAAAMRSLVMEGELHQQQVGKRGNRHAQVGLSLKDFS